MVRGVYSISLPPEVQEFFEKLGQGARSKWVTQRIKEAINMQEEKLIKDVEEAEMNLAEKKEVLEMYRKQKALEAQENAKLAGQKVEQIQKATIKTAEKAKLACPICNHPEREGIDAMIREMQAKKGSSTPIRDKYKVMPSQIYNHVQHMEV